MTTVIDLDVEIQNFYSCDQSFLALLCPDEEDRVVVHDLRRWFLESFTHMGSLSNARFFALALYLCKNTDQPWSVFRQRRVYSIYLNSVTHSGYTAPFISFILWYDQTHPVQDHPHKIRDYIIHYLKFYSYHKSQNDFQTSRSQGKKKTLPDFVRQVEGFYATYVAFENLLREIWLSSSFSRDFDDSYFTRLTQESIDLLTYLFVAYLRKRPLLFEYLASFIFYPANGTSESHKSALENSADMLGQMMITAALQIPPPSLALFQIIPLSQEAISA